MLTRRELLGTLATGLLAAPLAVEAQTRTKVARIGYLSGDSATAHAQYAQAFSNGLRDLGYVEGKNLVIEHRWAEGKFERLPDLAAELIRLPVEVIVAVGDPVIFAAKQATSTIPIVMVAVGDPVGRGFVASLARPGGNLTGISNLAVALTGKWLEILKETVPRLSQVSVLRNSANPTHPLFLTEAERTAPSLGLKLQSVEVHGSDDLDGAFAAMVRERSGALVVLPDPLLSVLLGGRIADLATTGCPRCSRSKRRRKLAASCPTVRAYWSISVAPLLTSTRFSRARNRATSPSSSPLNSSWSSTSRRRRPSA
jgi:putative ABC transport system substrate-binding protein